jgi:hypothetical protein
MRRCHFGEGQQTRHSRQAPVTSCGVSSHSRVDLLLEARGLPYWLQARGLPRRNRGAGQPRVGPTIGHGGAGVGRNHTAATALRSLPLEDVDAPLVGLMGCNANDRERRGGERFPFLKAGWRY